MSGPLIWSRIPWQHRKMHTKRSVKIKIPVENYAVSLAWRSLIETLERLKDAGTNICLIRTPVTREHLKLQDRDTRSRIDAYFSDIKKLAARMDLRFVSYERLGFEFTLDYFMNDDHLNDIGNRIFWPLAQQACFGGLPTKKPTAFQWQINNADLEHFNANKQPVKWQVEGKAKHLLRSYKRGRDGFFRTKTAFGAHSWKIDGKQVGHWSLSRQFNVKGAERVEIDIFGRPYDLPLPEKLPEIPEGQAFFAEDDAFIEVLAFDKDGELISEKRAGRPFRYSETMSMQALKRGLAGSTRAGKWYPLVHRFQVPKQARRIKIRIVATDGDGKIKPRGYVGGNAAIMFDDVQFWSDGRLEEFTS